MRIAICLRDERAASMHFVNVHGARDCPNRRMCVDRPLPRMQISRTDCGGMLSGCESKRLSDPQIETSPWSLFV